MHPQTSPDQVRWARYAFLIPPPRTPHPTPHPPPPGPQDSEYQQWYDEAAHPLRKQHHRPGGLEAAWAAVLGGPSGRSLVQLQLPRSLLEASGAMPWDAAAAACLHLLHALLGAVQRSASGSAGDAGGQAAQRELLQRVFGPQQREAGALAATRICQLSSASLACGSGGAWRGYLVHLSLSALAPGTRHTSVQHLCSWLQEFSCWAVPAGFGQVQAAMKSARDAPAGGSSVLLAAQLLSLLKGEQYFGRQYGNRSGDESMQGCRQFAASFHALTVTQLAKCGGDGSTLKILVAIKFPPCTPLLFLLGP